MQETIQKNYYTEGILEFLELSGKAGNPGNPGSRQYLAIQQSSNSNPAIHRPYSRRQSIWQSNYCMNVGALAVKDKWFFHCYFNAISMLYLPQKYAFSSAFDIYFYQISNHIPLKEQGLRIHANCNHIKHMS